MKRTSSNRPIDPPETQSTWFRHIARWLHKPRSATDRSSAAGETASVTPVPSPGATLPLSAPATPPPSPAPQTRASAKAPADRPPAREGEAQQTWFRTERVINENGAWYIATREGINVGPYTNSNHARREARKLSRLLQQKSVFGPQEQALTIRKFMNRPSFDNRRD